MTGTPDPRACADLTQFFLAYDQVARSASLSCSLTGSTMAADRRDAAAQPESPSWP